MSVEITAQSLKLITQQAISDQVPKAQQQAVELVEWLKQNCMQQAIKGMHQYTTTLSTTSDYHQSTMERAKISLEQDGFRCSVIDVPPYYHIKISWD